MESIETARGEDLPDILALQKLCYRETGERYQDFSIPPLTQDLESLRGDFARQTILKAVAGGRIIGSVRAYERDGTCFIGRVIVHPDFRNRGLGKRLMATIEHHYPAADRFELFTGCRDEKNLHFYAVLGYRRFREEPRNNLVFLEKPAPRR